MSQYETDSNSQLSSKSLDETMAQMDMDDLPMAVAVMEDDGGESLNGKTIKIAPKTRKNYKKMYEDEVELVVEKNDEIAELEEEVSRLKQALDDALTKRSKGRKGSQRKMIFYQKIADKSKFPERYGITQSQYLRKNVGKNGTNHTDNYYTLSAGVIAEMSVERRAYLNKKRIYGEDGDDLWFNSQVHTARMMKRLYPKEKAFKKVSSYKGKDVAQVGEWGWKDCPSVAWVEEEESETEDETDSGGEFEDSDCE